MLKTAVSIFSCQRNKICNFSTRNLGKMVDAKLEAVPLVEIDEGVFKYILIRVFGKEQADGSELSKKIVRGYTNAEWHTNIYERVSPPLKELGLDTECLGGGKIDHNPGAKAIKVYGASTGYGKADHAESRNILKTKYTDYTIEIAD